MSFFLLADFFTWGSSSLGRPPCNTSEFLFTYFGILIYVSYEIFMFQNFYKFRGNNIFVDPRVKPCISTIYFDFGIHAQAVLTMQITSNLYKFYIIGILTSSKLLLLRATWKRKGNQNFVGAVKNYKIVFVFFWKNYLFGEHLIFCIVLFAIFSSVTYFVSVKWDFVHSVISSFASPWSHFFVLIICFSIIQNLCKLFFLFHHSISSSCLHFISFFVWQAVLNRCPDKCVTSVEKVSLCGWFFYNVLSMRKYVTSVGKIEIHFSSSQIDFI